MGDRTGSRIPRNNHTIIRGNEMKVMSREIYQSKQHFFLAWINVCRYIPKIWLVGRRAPVTLHVWVVIRSSLAMTCKKVRDRRAQVSGEVCREIRVEPALTPTEGRYFSLQSTNTGHDSMPRYYMYGWGMPRDQGSNQPSHPRSNQLTPPTTPT